MKFICSITQTIAITTLLTAVLVMPFIGATELYDQQALKNKMFADLEVIKNTFEVKYAPADWKFSFTRWDLEEEMNVAKAKIFSIPNITVSDYQHIVKEFFKSAKDYHVEVNFFSTASAFLPFRIQRAEGKYFIVWVDSSSRKLLHVGDEILEFNGQPIHDVVEEFKQQEFGNPDSQTDQAFAEMFFTMRIGQMGHQVPQGSVTLVTRPKGVSKKTSQQFTWIYSAEEILQEAFYPTTLSVNKILKTEPALAKISSFQKSDPKLSTSPYFQKEMCLAQYKLIQAAYEQRSKKNKETDQFDEPTSLGSRKSFVPALGKKTWESAPNSFYFAYLFKCHNKTIGYIRIPEYMGGSFAAEEFASLIRLFQKRSDALVIDQVNNPGGIILNMYALASMLTPYPLHLPTQRITITQQDVAVALNVVNAFEEEIEASNTTNRHVRNENIVGYPLDQKFAQEVVKHHNFIIDEWNAGHYFTEPCYLYGIEELHPHPLASYNKPILVLVNQLDFSCADFLPAILQDNKRATIFGAQTAGAGGILLSHSHPNRFGIASYTLTGSITMRKNNCLIENHGVTPDIIYELTQNDLQNNYVDYVNAVQQAISKLVKKRI